MPGIAGQLADILSRRDIQDVFWWHLVRLSPIGFLADFFDGNVWKFWRTQPAPNAGPGDTWFGRPGFYECAFALNMYAQHGCSVIPPERHQFVWVGGYGNIVCVEGVNTCRVVGFQGRISTVGFTLLVRMDCGPTPTPTPTLCVA